MNTKTLVTALTLVGAISSYAGPVVIDGTDANDHGSFNGLVNVAGWEYMQRVLENLGPQVGNGQTKVVTLGADSGNTARNAINSAFTLSSLAGSWSIGHITGAADIATYLSGGTVGVGPNALSLANTGILYLPTAGLSSGDLDATELAAVNGGAAAIASFVGGAGTPAVGGGLFAMGESGAGAYGWLSTLVTGITFTDVGGGGISTDITLTGPGATAFPLLTNADLAGADPWHGYFSGNLGSLTVLGTALDNGRVSRNLILGGGAGTVITPDPIGAVPEVSTMASSAVLAGLAGLAVFRRRRSAAPAA